MLTVVKTLKEMIHGVSWPVKMVLIVCAIINKIISLSSFTCPGGVNSLSIITGGKIWLSEKSIGYLLA